jgi:crotonobetainyl-CoA:carnitine CoA-transferase CaiB-like acyl-CoA transferase
MLSDLGADVVKIEPPDGDSTRYWGRVVGGIPGYYQQQNAGKRNICIDLQAQGARELVLELVRHADLLIENYRPDVMQRLGLGYEALAAVNPTLIMLSISGFGRGGPESHRPAYAPIVHAELGLIARAAHRGDGEMRDLPLSVADTNASLHGLVALLAAVIMRERTGLGQHIDLAMIDATLATDDQLNYELEDAEHTRPLPAETWQTGAGPVLVSVDFRHLWRLLTTKMGVAEPAYGDLDKDGRIALRREAVVAFMAALTTWQQVEASMQALDLAWGQVRAGQALRDQPTVKFRGAIADVDDRVGGTRPVTQSPYRFSQAKSGVRGPAPHRGEHNADVLAQWLGKSARDIEQLTARGILSTDAQAPAAGPAGVEHTVESGSLK